MAGRNFLSHFATFLLLFFSSLYSFAGPSRTTYQARIVKPDGYPLEAANVNFKFTILDPTATCILYSETYSAVNMSSTSGLISFSLGSGTKTFPVSATTFEQVFSNITPFLACDSGGLANYSPSASDMRRIVMQFNDGNGWQTLPAMSINAVPYAMYADTATTLAGKTQSDFVQVTTIPTCTASEALRFNGSSFSCIAVGSGGGGSVTSSTVITALGYTPADGASVTTLTSNLNSVSSSVGTVNSTIASVSSTVYSVSSTVSALSSTVTTLSSTLNSVSGSLTSLTSTVNSVSTTVSTLSASFSTFTSSQWVTSGSAISYVNGFVGIGTSAPTGTLDVRPTAAASASPINLIAQNSNAGNTAGGAINIIGGDGFAATTRAVGGSINLTAGRGAGLSGLATQMRGGGINLMAGQGGSGGGLGGNVVIIAGPGGSTSGVGGYVQIQGGYSNYGTGGMTTIYGGSSAEGSGAPARVYGGSAGSVSGNAFLGGYAALEGGSGINGGAGGDVYISGGYGNSTYANIFLQTTASGNVGVGMTTPTARLHLPAATTFAPLKFTSSTLLAAPSSGAVEYDGFNFYVTDSTNTRRAIATVGSGSSVDYTSAISGTSNISLTPTGSVIVSSTTASTNAATGALIVKGGLGVSGSIYSSGTITTTNTIQGTSITATSGLIAPYIYGSTAAANNLYLDSTTHSSKGYVLIGNGGSNVGMGTTMPLAKLYVDADGMSPNIPMPGTVAVFDNESANMGIALMTSNNHNASYYFGTTSMASRGAITYSMGNTPSLDKLSIDVNFASRLQISNSGTVGIGLPIASSPAAMLQVVNNDLAQDNLALKAAPSQSANWFRLTDSNDVTRIYASPNGGMPTIKLGVTNAIALTSEYGGINEIPAGASLNTTGNLGLFNTMGTAGAKVMTGYFNGTNFYSAWEIANVSSGLGSLLLMKSGGYVGIGTTSNTARLNIGSGTTAVAPLKIVSGALVSSPQSGTIEYDGYNFYVTDGTNTRRAVATDSASNLNLNGLTVSGATNITNSGNLYLTAAAADAGDIIFQTSSGTQKGRVWSDPVSIGMSLSSGDTIPDIYIDSAGRVGIGGTVAPTAALEVSGAIKVPGVGQIGPNGLYGYGLFTTGTNTFIGQMYGAASGVQFTNSVGANTLMIHESGSVGIGTTSPTSKLQVSASNSNTNVISANCGGGWCQNIIQSGGVIGDFGANAATSIVYGGANSNHPYVIRTNSTERMRVDTAGNVSIGSASSGAKVDIYGSGYLLKVSGNVSGTTAADIIIQRSSTAKTVGRGAAIQLDDTSNNNNNILFQQAQGDFQFFNNSSGSWVERFTIASGGAVGIGVTAPAAQLEVRNKAQVSNATNGSTSNVSSLNSDSTNGAYVHVRRDGANEWFMQADPSANNVLNFRHGNVTNLPDLSINQSGYVGIGTSAPAVRTHIYNQVDGPFVGLAIDNRKIYGAGTGVNETARMIFSLSEPTLADPNSRVMGYIEGGTESETSSAQTFMAFGTRSGAAGSESEKMRINSAGYVGIGTSAPSASLNIGGLGAANATALRIDSQDTYYRDIFMSEFNTTSYGGILRYHSGLDLLQLITVEAGVEKYGVAVARATGFVGIGMNSAAQYQLDVNGDIRISGTPYRAGGDIAWTVPSDARLKDVVRTYDRGLNQILNIDTIIYRYKKGNVKDIDPTKEYSGVLAQQVQEQIPEAVKVDKDGYLSLNTTPIFWAMLNSIKEIYHKVLDVMKNDQAQDREIASVKEENAAIKAENAKIKQENSEIKAYLCAKDPSAPICK